jgi:TPR repeat protein
MSYVINIWEQPNNIPLPETEHAIWQMLGRLYEMPSRRNPKFQELARQLMSMYPEENGEEGDHSIWLECKADGDTDEPVWNLGLYSGERLDEVQAMVAAHATALGLNVADEQAGDLYLADGRILSERDGAHCMRAFAAYFSGHQTTAWQEFLSLASKGNRVAMRNLASMCIRGEAVKKNYPLGQALLVLAGEAEEALKLYDFLKPEMQLQADSARRKLREPAQFTATVNSLTTIATELTLTSLSSDSKPIEKKPSSNNLNIAAILELANAGDHEAWLTLASCYKSGEGVTQCDEEAARWWGLAARKGIAEAQFNLALSYALGEGVAKDEKSAFKWYGQAADQGHANAIYNFGVMHAQGKVVPEDLVAANLLYAYAKVKGCEHAPMPTFTPVNAGQAIELIHKMTESGKVLDTLGTWRRMKTMQQGAKSLDLNRPVLEASTKPTNQISRRVHTDTEPETRATSSLHIGHAALVVGALQGALFIWLTPENKPALAILILGMLALTGAYGAWRVARDQEFSSGITALIVLLALVPMIGMLPCIGLLLKLIRQKMS